MVYSVGQYVFVPNGLVGRSRESTAVGRFRIAEVGAGSGSPRRLRSVRVVLKPEEDPDSGWVAASLVHPKIGINIVRIGDLSSEIALLDPLAKSLDHFMRLLVGHDYFNLTYVRTQLELEQFWAKRRGATTHLVLIAHGKSDAIRLVGSDANAGFEQWFSGEEFSTLLDSHGADPGVHLLSLCCLTGYAAFAGTVSSVAAIRTCAAPLRDVHGAVASQFCQTLFAEHLLHGTTWPIAFRHARASTPGTSTFRLWQDGGLVQGASGR